MTANVVRLSSVTGEPDRYPETFDLRSVMRHGDRIRRPVRYPDDVWELHGSPDLTSRTRTIRFTKIPEPYRPMAKDYALLITSPTLATEWAPDVGVARTHAQRRPVAWSTARTRTQSMAAPLTRMVDANMTALEPGDWNQLTDLLLEAGPTRETLARAAQTLRTMHDLAPVLGRPAPFGTRPWGTREINAAVGHRPPVAGEHRNKTRPHGHVGAALGVCIWMLDHIADDVLDRLDWWHTRPTLVARDADGRLPDGSIRKILDAYRDAAGGYPLVDGAHSARALEMFAGLDRYQDDGKKRPLKLTAYAELPGWVEGADPYPGDVHCLPTADGLVTWTDRPLLPISRLSGGLYWWADRLVYAAYYVVAATTALRARAMDAIPPGCIHEGIGATNDMHAYLVKQPRTDVPPQPATWTVNSYVVKAVRFVERLHEIYGDDPPVHPRTGQPRLFHTGLLRGPGRNRKHRDAGIPFGSSTEQPAYLWSAAEALADRGLIRGLDGIKPQSLTVIRATALDTYANRPLGDAVAAAMGKWSNINTMYGYVGHRPMIVTPADLDEAREHATRHQAGYTLLDAVDDPDALTGKARDRLVATAEAAVELPGGPISEKQLFTAAKENGHITVGTLGVCVYGPGGLCGDAAHANHRLCQLDCRNLAQTRYHRARLEYSRRQRERMGPAAARFGAKLGQLGPQIIDEFADTTDEELVDILTETWDPLIRQAVFDDD